MKLEEFSREAGPAPRFDLMFAMAKRCRWLDKLGNPTRTLGYQFHLYISGQTTADF